LCRPFGACRCRRRVPSQAKASSNDPFRAVAITPLASSSPVLPLCGLWHLPRRALTPGRNTVLATSDPDHSGRRRAPMVSLHHLLYLPGSHLCVFAVGFLSSPFFARNNGATRGRQKRWGEDTVKGKASAGLLIGISVSLSQPCGWRGRSRVGASPCGPWPRSRR
jgi:hypothetical protein